MFFSLAHGVSIHINGHLHGSQTKPTIVTPGPLLGHPTAALCVGSCSHQPHSGLNMLVQNMVAAGLHAFGLVRNGLAG